MKQLTPQDAMLRPVLMVQAAGVGARHYRRQRDLPAAVPGLLAEPREALLPRLAREEAALEARRREGAAGYRPGRHLQVLAAFLAECRDAGITPAAAAREAAVGPQAKASASRSFRFATKSRRPSSTPGSIGGA
ncbi:MAG TPA: DUF6477 family protein [Thermohalobaculum sp.]|nr:DUF6477 family protein [Thermohalobaculum sp.]